MGGATPSDEQVRAWCARALPEASPGEVSALSGGLLNHVWRVETASGPVVLKHTPGFVASNPELELSSRRGAFERDALEWAASFGSARARAPRVLGGLDAPRILVLEDLGERAHLGEILEDAPRSVRVCGALGELVAALHVRSAGDVTLARRFDNADVQRVRQLSQYARVGGWLEGQGVEDAARLGARAHALGAALTSPGVCVVMGDLWPPSVLCDGEDARVIDWEFAHFGRPCQDVAHLGAHLWLAAEGGAGEGAAAGWVAFMRAYTQRAGALWGEDERRASATHFAAEVLTRTVGAFAGSVAWAPAREVAVARAAEALRSGRDAWFERAAGATS